jgi:uncharacterized protein
VAPQRPSVRSIRSLEVVLTTACNLGCAYCYQDVRAERSMSWGVLRRAIDLLLSSGHPEPELAFYGGEPLLELASIHRALEYLEDSREPGRPVRASVFTNGILLDPGTAGYLARHGVDVQISFDGVEAAQELRAPGTFRRLERALTRLRHEHPGFFRDRCSVAITVSSRNLAHLAESCAYLLDHGVAEIAAAALVTHDPGWHPDTLETLADQVEQIYDASVDHFKNTGEVPFAPFRQGDPRRTPSARPPAMCAAAGTTSLAVDVDGQVYGCVLFAESYQSFPNPMLRQVLEPLRLGDVRAKGLGRRLEGYPVSAGAAGILTDRARKRSSYRTCRGCRFVGECSACPASIGHIPGNTDPHRIPDLQCAFNLAVLTARRRFLEETGIQA